MRAVLALAVVVASVGPAAATTPLPERGDHSVHDAANVIDDAREQALEAINTELYARAKVAVVVITVPRLVDETISELAVRVQHDWGVGLRAAASAGAEGVARAAAAQGRARRAARAAARRGRGARRAPARLPAMGAQAGLVAFFDRLRMTSEELVETRTRSGGWSWPAGPAREAFAGPRVHLPAAGDKLGGGERTLEGSPDAPRRGDPHGRP